MYVSVSATASVVIINMAGFCFGVCVCVCGLFFVLSPLPTIHIPELTTHTVRAALQWQSCILRFLIVYYDKHTVFGQVGHSTLLMPLGKQVSREEIPQIRLSPLRVNCGGAFSLAVAELR